MATHEHKTAAAPREHAVLPARIRVPAMKALSRPRRDRIMTQALDHRLTLVCGPAGYGKTTVLAQFAHASLVPVAWYRAEVDDTSASSFLAHVAQAVQQATG